MDKLPGYIKQGIYFTLDTGEERAIGNWSGCIWIFHRHPDGQWVSLEKLGGVQRPEHEDWNTANGT